MINRQWIFNGLPQGRLTPDTFSWREGAVPSLADGEVLVRTRMLSLDPANRAWMNGRTYRQQVLPGDVMHGFTLSEVVTSSAPQFAPGDLVDCMGGWQDYAVLPAYELTKRDGRYSPEMLIGILGVTGMTAYHGLFDIGRPLPGDTVLVSAAGGAVGTTVGQMAKLSGCTVIGIAGGPNKCHRLVQDLGFDGAIDYKAANFRKLLKAACPNGVDVYFDNVGGPVLDAALLCMNQGGRIVCCGSVSGYDNTEAAVGSVMVPGLLVTKRLRMEGFIVLDYAAQNAKAEKRLASWVEAGQLRPMSDIIEGLEGAPEGLVRLLDGGNFGKMSVRVA